MLFQDEIDCLQKEVEELKSKNLSLESQIKTILDPLTLVQGNQNEDKHLVTDNPTKINPETVAEWKKKLRTANEIYEKVKDDVDKLKEVSCGFKKSIMVVFKISTFKSINSCIILTHHQMMCEERTESLD